MVENLTLGHGNCGGLHGESGLVAVLRALGGGATPSREHRQPQRGAGEAVGHAVTDLTPGLRSGIQPGFNSSCSASSRLPA